MNILEAKHKIKLYLDQIAHEDVQEYEDDEFIFPDEHGVTMVRVKQWSSDYCIATLTSPIIFGVPESPEFYEYIAQNAHRYRLAQLAIEEWKGGFIVMFKRYMVCELLSRKELEMVMAQISFTMVAIRSEIQSKFGGRFPP